MTRSEAYALRATIVNAAKTIPDEAAPSVKWMFDKWHPNTAYITGDRRTDGDVLYKCRQNHTSQAHQRPADVPALWEVVAPPEQTGTRDNPIAFSFGMAVNRGLFYIEDYVLYEAIYDSINPLYNRLADLIGIYVQVAN